MSGSAGSRLVRAALRCYPRGWRERHGAEAAELAQMLAADGSPLPAIALSYFVGAGRARTRLTKRRARAAAGASLAAVPVVWAALSLLAPTAQASPVGNVRPPAARASHAGADHPHGPERPRTWAVRR